MSELSQEIAAAAARLVVEEGLEYGPAKRRAVKVLGLNARAQLPGNDEVEEAVEEYLAIFCADTQPAELAALVQSYFDTVEKTPKGDVVLAEASGAGAAA